MTNAPDSGENVRSVDPHPPEPLATWLREALDRHASDLHLAAGSPPLLRVHGKLEPIGDSALSPEQLESQLMPICSEAVTQQLAEHTNVDFSYALSLSDRVQRFRINYFRAGRSLGACLRVIPTEIPSLEWANFPADLAQKLTSFRNGLVLVSGVTGSGKSTTLAMLIQMLNAAGHRRILTIEEPVEYVFPSMPHSLVTQREVGVDVHTFFDGLKYGLRQDPDVILVGEIRDPETARMALSATETGLLVFGTLHAKDAKGVISRYTDLYPPEAQHEVRSQLADGLRAVLCQHLLPSSFEDKRELALEVMLNNSRIASGIRQAKLQSLDDSVRTSRDEGMMPLDESLRQLLAAGRISQETARMFGTDSARF